MLESISAQYLKRLELLHLTSRRSFLGSKQGGHASIKRGHGIEFADFRKYELGDDPRHIDWNLYARSEKMYIKRFQEEQDITIHIIADSSNSMFLPEANKWKRVLEVILSIAYVASVQQDRVQLAIPGYLNKKRYTGANTVHRIYNDLKNLDKSPCDDFISEANTSIASASFPGIVFFISDFLTPLPEIKEIFKSLIGKNLDIKAIQVLGEKDLNPSINENLIVIDSESQKQVELNLNENSLNEYKKLLTNHNEELAEFLKARNIQFVNTNVKDSIEEVMFKKFKKLFL